MKQLFSFYKGLSWLLVLNVAIKPLWVFGIDRVVQNRVGYETYGLYFSNLGLCISLVFLADVGLTGLMNRELASGGTLNIKSLLSLKSVFSMVYAGLVCFIASITKVESWLLLIQVITIQLLTSYLVFFRAIISAKQFFKKDAWISVIDKSLMIIFCGLFLYTSLSVNLSLSLFLWLQIGALTVAVSAAAIVALGNKRTAPAERKTALIAKAFPFMVLILLMSAHNRIDAFLLGRFHSNGAYESGIYASAYRLLDAGNILGYLVASFLVPFVAGNLQKSSMIIRVTITLRHGLLFVAFIILAFVLVFSSQIQSWLYPALSSYDPNILVLCMATLPALYLTHIYGSLLTAKGELRTFSIIVGMSLFINLVLNIFLISKGAIGCCVAALASQCFCAAGCMLACRNKMAIALRPVSACIVAAIGVLYWGLFYIGSENNLSWSILVLIAVVLTAFVMFAWWRQNRKALSYN